MSSFVTIGHELWIILTFRTTYHFIVCSTFHRSIMKDTNTTVGYSYNYHYCTYVQFFFLLSCDISLLHTRHYTLYLSKAGTYNRVITFRKDTHFKRISVICHRWTLFLKVYLTAKLPHVVSVQYCFSLSKGWCARLFVSLFLVNPGEVDFFGVYLNTVNEWTEYGTCECNTIITMVEWLSFRFSWKGRHLMLCYLKGLVKREYQNI